MDDGEAVCAIVTLIQMFNLKISANVCDIFVL